MSIASNRLKLLAILALFLLPLLAAILMFSGHLPKPSGDTINQGKLIEPPVALDWATTESAVDTTQVVSLLDSWVILLALPADCETNCLQKVAGLRQVHKASGREQQRLKLVLLSGLPVDIELHQQLLAVYDQFTVLTDPSGSLQQSLQTTMQRGGLSATTVSSYLVDPLGNIMMAYDMADSEARMSKDLKRLLTWSKQDKS